GNWSCCISAGDDGDTGAVTRGGEHLAQLAAEVVGGGVGDGDGRDGAGTPRPAHREVDESVLAGAPGEHRGVALGGPFDDDRLVATDPRPVVAERRPLDDVPEALEALDAGRVGDEPVGEPGRFGALTRREDERV